MSLFCLILQAPSAKKYELKVVNRYGLSASEVSVASGLLDLSDNCVTGYLSKSPKPKSPKS